MYFVFERTMVEWQNQILQAQMQGEKLPFTYQDQFWLDQPLLTPPMMTFAISADAPLIDNYFTQMSIDLYSARLIQLLRAAGVKFESFSTIIIDLATKHILPLQYEVFHLLEVFPGLDEQRSELEQKEVPEIRKLVLTNTCLQSQKPLLRLKNYENIVLIHQDLKAALELAGITGCRYTPTDTFTTMWDFIATGSL